MAIASVSRSTHSGSDPGSRGDHNDLWRSRHRSVGTDRFGFAAGGLRRSGPRRGRGHIRHERVCPSVGSDAPLDRGGAPGSSLPRFPRDELLKTGVLDGIRAVVFDMDGTLVDSSYDWPTIRRQLGVSGASIIDDLNALAEPERSRKWAELEEIEKTATENAQTVTRGPRGSRALCCPRVLRPPW